MAENHHADSLEVTAHLEALDKAVSDSLIERDELRETLQEAAERITDILCGYKIDLRSLILEQVHIEWELRSLVDRREYRGAVARGDEGPLACGLTVPTSVPGGDLAMRRRLKKTILLFDPNEQSHSRNRFLLKTRSYRVLSAREYQDTLDILVVAVPGEVDLLWVTVPKTHLQLAYSLIRSAKAFCPGLNALLTVTGRVSEADAGRSPADILLYDDRLVPALVLLQIRTLVTRKRGPKKRTPTPVAAPLKARSAA